MKRTVPGILLAAGWLLLLLKGSFLLFWALVVLISFIGGREFCRMVFPDILYETDRVVLSIIITIPVFTAVYCQNFSSNAGLGLFLAFFAMVGFTMFHYTRFENPFKVFNRGVLGIIFVGFLASHLVLIRGLSDGSHWLVLLTAITAGSDTFAYWVGCRWGRRKLCPHISPNKTVEGALGGLFGALLSAFVLSRLFEVQASLPVILSLALLLSVVGMIGDLLESIIKRGTSTKDSGSMLGGHGGILDRVDSLLLTAPLLYYTLIYTGY